MLKINVLKMSSFINKRSLFTTSIWSLLSSSLKYKITPPSSSFSLNRYISTLPLIKTCHNINNKLPLYNINNSFQHQYQSIRNMGCKRFLKTKQSAAKRFIVTGKGKLKFSHQGKAHLNGHKTRKQIRRLNSKGRVSGTMEKNMKMLILNGK
jgi:large subunit ribosomal protein L35